MMRIRRASTTLAGMPRTTSKLPDARALICVVSLSAAAVVRSRRDFCRRECLLCRDQAELNRRRAPPAHPGKSQHRARPQCSCRRHQSELPLGNPPDRRQVADDPDISNKPFIEAGDVYARLQLTAVARRIEVTEIVLDQPVIRIVQTRETALSTSPPSAGKKSPAKRSRAKPSPGNAGPSSGPVRRWPKRAGRVRRWARCSCRFHNRWRHFGI